MELLRQARWLALIFLTVAPLASAGGNELVKAQLVANTTAIQPGQPFELAVLFRIAPGWHIYWKNAGDAGAPTTVEFKLPDGFKVDALKFPAPFRFEMPGPIISFGYEDEVMLFATVTCVSATLRFDRVAASSALGPSSAIHCSSQISGVKFV